MGSQAAADCPPAPAIPPVMIEGVEYRLVQKPMEFFGEPREFEGWYIQSRLQAVDAASGQALWDKFITQEKYHWNDSGDELCGSYAREMRALSGQRVFIRSGLYNGLGYVVDLASRAVLMATAKEDLLISVPGQEAGAAAPGSAITVAVDNLSGNAFEVGMVRVDRLVEGDWQEVRGDVRCPCLAECELVDDLLAPGQQRQYPWDGAQNDCSPSAGGQ